MTKRQGLRMVSFALLTVLMLLGLGEFLRDRETTLSSFYSEPDGTVDVFVVGSSRVNSASIPGVLWQEYGISAHNVFSWAQPVWISYHYIKEGLKTQTPEVVVLDMGGMMYGHSTQQPEAIDDVNYKNSFTIDPGLNFLEMIGTVKDCGIDLRDPVDFLNLVRFHARWKYIGQDNFTYSAHNQRSYLKGYGIQVGQHEADAPLPPEAAQAAPPYETCVEYLDKIVALSEKEGFALVFVMMPYVYQENEPAIYEWLAEYAAGHGIPFSNYCTVDGERIGFDWTDELSDAEHVNYKGALRITRDIGSFLQANYSFRQPEALPNKAQLDADAAMMRRTLDINAATLAGTDAFFEWVAGTKATFALVQGAGPVPEVPAALAEALGLAALPGLAGAQGESYIGVWQAGELHETAGPGPQAAEVPLNNGQTLALTSNPALAEGVWAQLAEKQFAGSEGLFGLYYDEVLQRVVYVAHFAPDGTVTLTEMAG